VSEATQKNERKFCAKDNDVEKRMSAPHRASLRTYVLPLIFLHYSRVPMNAAQTSFGGSSGLAQDLQHPQAEKVLIFYVRYV
jgi:hypothetical protein